MLPRPLVIHGHLVLVRPRIIQRRGAGFRLLFQLGAPARANLSLPASLSQPKKQYPQRRETNERADDGAGDPRFGRGLGRRCAGCRGRRAGGLGEVDALAWVGARLRIRGFLRVGRFVGLRGFWGGRGGGGKEGGGRPGGDGGAVGGEGDGCCSRGMISRYAVVTDWPPTEKQA